MPAHRKSGADLKKMHQISLILVVMPIHNVIMLMFDRFEIIKPVHKFYAASWARTIASIPRKISNSIYTRNKITKTYGKGQISTSVIINTSHTYDTSLDREIEELNFLSP